MDSYNICVCFSDTGGGHRSAAEAVAAGIEELAPEVDGKRPVNVFLENMAERSHPINQFFVDLYNYLLRHRQEWMKYYYWFIEASKPNDSALGYMLARKYVIETIGRIKPAVVVSVHPMANHYLARALAEMGLAGRVKLIEVITDPNANLWTGWACKDADLIIAPNDLAYDRLVSWGIDRERLKVSGMPIQPQFLKPPVKPRGEFLKNLGLEEGVLTVCITAGWAGGGNMADVYRALARVKKTVQVVFICGHNKDLYAEIASEAGGSGIRTAVLPFHESMSDLMSSVDLLVTKAGGLTTFEAIARRLPMALDLLKPAMPQESGTADMLISAGLARPLRNPEDIVAIVESTEVAPDRQSVRLPAVHSLDRVDAVYDIAGTILAACNPALARAETPALGAQRQGFDQAGLGFHLAPDSY